MHPISILRRSLLPLITVAVCLLLLPPAAGATYMTENDLSGPYVNGVSLEQVDQLVDGVAVVVSWDVRYEGRGEPVATLHVSGAVDATDVEVTGTHPGKGAFVPRADLGDEIAINLTVRANGEVQQSRTATVRVVRAAVPEPRLEVGLQPRPSGDAEVVPGPQSSSNFAVQLVPTSAPKPVEQPLAAAVAGPADHTPPTLQLRVASGSPGELQRTNRLVLRVRASERSLWRLRIHHFGSMRSTLAFAPTWRIVVINLGDRNRVGRALNATAPGARVRLRVRVHGWDRQRNVAAARWVTLIARA